MENISDKTDVLNPTLHFNTVGIELLDIFHANGFNISDLPSIGIDADHLDLKTKFTQQEINDIVKVVGIKEIGDYLKNFQSDYHVSVDKSSVEYKRNKKIFKSVEQLIPLLESDFTDGIDLLEDISNFLGIDDESKIFDIVNDQIALYKISNFVPDSLNLFAWLRRGEIDFSKLKLVEYNMNQLQKWIDDREWEAYLKDINYLKQLPQVLSNYGLGLIFTPYLNKTVLGAVRWFNEKPLIQLSDKGKSLASVWYTLFHEFGHVIKHRNDMIFENSLDIPKSKLTKKEQEANSFAYDYLFNGDSLRKYIFKYHNQHVNDSFIQDQSARFRVDKMFVAYWMSKAQIKNNLIREYLPQISF